MTTIIKDEDLPERMKNQQYIAHKIAEQAFDKIWDMSVEDLYKIRSQVTGNDALCYFGTIIADFSGRWIIEMNKIAQKDQAGITTEDLVKDTVNGILAKIGCVAQFEEEPQLPNGIKRLNTQEQSWSEKFNILKEKGLIE